jgi:hypothetical protein
MRTARYPETLIVKIDSPTRQAIEKAANDGGFSMGEITRTLLAEAMARRMMA